MTISAWINNMIAHWKPSRPTSLLSFIQNYATNSDRSSSDTPGELAKSTSTSSSSTCPSLLPCCFFQILAKNSGVLACSMVLSSRTLRNRGKRRLKPRVKDPNPLAATETGLKVMLRQIDINQMTTRLDCRNHVLRPSYFPDLLRPKIYVWSKTWEIGVRMLAFTIK